MRYGFSPKTAASASMSRRASSAISSGVWRPSPCALTGANLAPDHGHDQRPHRRRHLFEELRWACGEIGIVDPAVADHGPIEVVLAHLLDRPSDRPPLGGQTGVEVDAVFALQMQADEARVGDDRAVVVDVGQLAL